MPPPGVRVPMARYLRGLRRQADRALKRMADARDNEALHDFRVAVRRLRSWVYILDRAKPDTDAGQLRVDLKTMAHASNGLRDDEIARDWLLRYARTALPGQQSAIHTITRALAREHRSNLGLTRENLRRDWPRASASLGPLLGVPDWSGTSRRLVAALRKYRRNLSHLLRDITSADDVAALHRARILAKRQRYLLEPFREHDAAIAETVRALTQLQDELGAFHDLVVMRSRFKIRARHAGLMKTTFLALVRSLRREQLTAFTKLNATCLGKHRHAFIRRLKECGDVIALMFE